jgi:Flp pilus assembly protein TadD
MKVWYREILVCVLLAAGTAVAFAPTLGNDFVNYDDQDYITQNPQVQAGLTGPGVWWALTTAHASNWHPLTWLSLQLDRQLYGPGARGFHFTNLLLHTANAILLFLALRGLTGAVWRSALVAALFALHPLHVESVAWAAERKDVLSTLFWMLTLVAYLGYVRRQGLGRYALVALAFTLGLLAKPMLVTLPCVLLLLDVWPLRRWQPGQPQSAAVAGRLLLEKAPLFALAAVSSAITFWAQRRGGAVASLEVFPLDVRLGNAVVAYVRYLWLMLWPSSLAVFYPHPGAALPFWQVGGATLVLAVLTVLIIHERQRHPYLLVGWLWYLGTLVPVLGIVQVGEQALADRYTYVPLIGVFLALVWGMVDLIPCFRYRGVVLAAAAAAVLVALTVATRNQVRCWHDRATLWAHAAQADPDNHLAHYNLGVILLEQGQRDRAREEFQEAVRARPTDWLAHNNLGTLAQQRGDHEEAAYHFAAALKSRPEQPSVRGNLGLALAMQGQLPEARSQFDAALRVDPTDAELHNGLGMTLGMMGDAGGAAGEFTEAIRLNPRHAEAHFNLGVTRENLGRPAEALVCYGQAVELRPNVSRYRASLASCLQEQGRAEDAAREYQELLRRDPGWPEQTDRTARALATHPDPRGRNGGQALRLAKQVCQATGRRRPEFLDTLAAAYAETGHFTEAVAVAREALAHAAGDPSLSRRIEGRLRLYEDRQPYHDTEPGGRP